MQVAERKRPTRPWTRTWTRAQEVWASASLFSQTNLEERVSAELDARHRVMVRMSYRAYRFTDDGAGSAPTWASDIRFGGDGGGGKVQAYDTRKPW